MNGNWGEWTAFGDCNASCGGGNKTRYRECNNPEPSAAGEKCPNFEDTSIDTEPCNLESCEYINILYISFFQ